MKKTILALLVAKFQGVRKDALGVLASVLALQATNEDEAKALVEKVTDAQVTEFAKDYRADVDKEVSESNKTFETNLRKKYDFKEKQNEPGIPPTEDPNDIAAIVKEAVAAAVKPFEEKLSSYETKNIAETRLADSDFDFVFADIWHDPSDGVPAYKRLKETEKYLPSADFSYWIEKTLKCYI